MAKRAYDMVRTMVEEQGGKMWYQRKGQPAGGAWMISYQGYNKSFPTVGHYFPGLDELHVPKVQFPKSWDDFKNELIPDAWEKLLDALKQ